MNNLEVMFSRKSDEWVTPQDLFDEINKEFDFDLDPCATNENHKCDNYYTIEQNGLDKKWGGEECSVIHHIARLINGLQRHFMRPGMIIL